jgi:hypothetical protein
MQARANPSWFRHSFLLWSVRCNVGQGCADPETPGMGVIDRFGRRSAAAYRLIHPTPIARDAGARRLGGRLRVVTASMGHRPTGNREEVAWRVRPRRRGRSKSRAGEPVERDCRPWPLTA